MRLASGLCLALAAASAPAQPIGPYNPRVADDVAQIDKGGEKAARRTLHQFGKCVVKRSRSRAAAFIELGLDDPRYSKRLLDLATAECLGGGGLKIPKSNFRGAIFEALYHIDFEGVPIAFAPDIRSGFADLNKNATSEEAKNRIALEQFGECVVRAETSEVRNLLRTEPTSPAESASFDRLMPMLGGCIPKDRTITFSKTILRGALAEGIYWLAKASLPAAT